MITFDQSLYALFRDGKISEQDALHHADSANDLRLMIKIGDPNANSLNSLSGVALEN